MNHVGLALGLALLAGQGTGAPPDPVQDWHEVQARVVAQLERHEVGAWADELAAESMPASLADLFERLQISARAGRDGPTREVLAALARATGDLERPGLGPVPYFFIRREDWAGARAAFELLPRAEPTGAYSLVRHWKRQGDPRELDAWLAERATLHPAWLDQWLRLRQEIGGVEEILEQLEQKLRARPDDLGGLEAYARAMKTLGRPGAELDWLAQVVVPDTAYASYRVGEQVSRAWPGVGRGYYERALLLPLSPEEARAIELSFSVPLTRVAGGTTPEELVRTWSRHALVRVCREMGDAQRAQEVLEELAEAYPDGIPSGLLHEAGRVQAASGARVFEGRVLDEERERGQDAAYWLERAAYFRGRGETQAEREALAQALDLARGGEGAQLGRARDAWADHLWRDAGREPALEFLVEELATCEPGSEEARAVVGGLLRVKNDLSSQPAPEVEAYWNHLAAREGWERQEELLLWGMLRCLDARARGEGVSAEELDEAREALWSRAEGLARLGPPSRAAVLGWVMTRSREPARAIPHLRSALERLPAGREADAVAFDLFGAHLDAGDWRGAEAAEPRARARLRAIEIVEWRGRLALCAAEAGDPAAALRLWGRRVALDRGDLRGLEELAEAGMREHLIGFYRALLERDPGCDAAFRALDRLL